MFKKINSLIQKLLRGMRYLTMPLPAGIVTRIRFRLKGFIPDRALIYDLKNNNIKDYLNDVARSKTFRINEYFYIIAQDKIISSEILSPHVSVPKIFAYLHKGEIMPMDESWDMFRGNIENIVKIITLPQVYFFKPVRSGRGYGVMKLVVDSEELNLNSIPVTIDQLRNKLSNLEHYIIQKAVQQDDFGTSLFPKSTNTMRLVTMVDPYNYETFMPFGVHRVGVNASAPRDNFSAGGITFPIDMETGALGKGGKIVNHSVQYYDHHPETGFLINGKKIPRWSYIKESIIEIAKKFPYLKYLSWDVVVSNGEVVVIEFGNTTDVDLIQIHFPILADTRVRRFYEYYKII